LMLVYLIGLFTGILSGMAVGGGTLLVPALVLGLGVEQHLAQGVCLASFIPTAVVAVITHYRQNNVRTKLALALALGAAAGALLGASLAGQVDTKILRRLFGAVRISMGLYELLGKIRNAS
jgi:uncharacterized membrane protein YfcA